MPRRGDGQQDTQLRIGSLLHINGDNTDRHSFHSIIMIIMKVWTASHPSILMMLYLHIRL